MINRKKTIEVMVGNVGIGGKNPIRIQSMTNTLTADIDATLNQCVELINAGSELVRMTVNDDEASKAVPEIKQRLLKLGHNTPIIGDFHFNGHILLNKFPEMAKALDKFRINPGNVGRGDKRDTNFEEFIGVAVKYDKPVRIGVNGGSLDDDLLSFNMSKNAESSNPKSADEVFVDTLVESAIISINKAIELGLSKNKIIVSAKVSDIQSVVRAYELLSEKTDCPLHVGLTEAGGMNKGVVATASALGILLQKGIGDTIRASLTPVPGQSRSLEVEVCKLLLQTMGFRDFQPIVTSCPGCGRTLGDRFQRLAKQVTDEISLRMPDWKNKYKGFEGTRIAVMGCVVNGIGEAKNADIGIYIPGNNEDPVMPICVKGKTVKTVKGGDAFPEFMELVEKYFNDNFKK